MERIALEEKGGCSPFIGCGVPGCLLPIVGVLAVFVTLVVALLERTQWI